MNEQEKQAHAASRRKFLKVSSMGAAMALLGGGLSSRALAAECGGGFFFAPHETDLQTRTWMAWPASSSIWGSDLAGVQSDIALIAKTIAKYQPVTMCADGTSNASTARSKCGTAVTVISDIPVNDCWMRDSGCLFRIDDMGKLDAVGLNFNGWGGKQTYGKDGYVAERMASKLGLPFTRAGFVSEPGAIETDGEGTLIATESSIINANRNPGKSKAQLEAAMLAAYGASKVIWVPGVVGMDITDDHIDATTRFVRPGVVMIQVSPPNKTGPYDIDSRQQYDILSKATDAKGRLLQVIKVDPPVTPRVKTPDFLSSYLNFYPVNGAVITAQFGDATKDAAAKAALAQAFPGRTIEMLNLDRLYGGGGGVHCVTQHQPVA